MKKGVPVRLQGVHDFHVDVDGVAGRNASGDPVVEAVRAADRARHRLRALFLVVAVLMVVFAAVAVLALRSIRSDTVEIAGKRLPSVRLIEEIRNRASTHRSIVLTHAITNDPARIDSLESAIVGVDESVRRNLDAYRALLSGRKDADLHEKVSESWKAYTTAAVRVLPPSRVDDFNGVRAVVDSDLNPSFDQLNRRLDQWIALNLDAANAGLRQVEDAFDASVGAILIMLLLVLGVRAGGARLAMRAIKAGEKSTSELLDAALLDSNQAGVFQRFADRLTFASGEDDLVWAARATLRRLVDADRGDLLLLNPSRDRLSVGTAWGPEASEAGSLVECKPDRCPGIRRGALYLASDLSDELEVRCQAHPTSVGSLLCLPMIALGQTVGVIHLERSSNFRDEEVRLAVRTCEQVSVALANARLLRTMESLAMTDALTGLHNARSFDPLMDFELTAAARDRRSIAGLMIDIDNFKKLNDTHGHQAGDEALRSFGRTMRATLRESDPAARYGGEEFVVMLRSVDDSLAVQLADKLRLAVEHTVIEIAPGREIRMTASIGVATTDQAGHDRMNLLRLADHALYRAKQSGRNQVKLADPLLDSGPGPGGAELATESTGTP